MHWLPHLSVHLSPDQSHHPVYLQLNQPPLSEPPLSNSDFSSSAHTRGDIDTNHYHRTSPCSAVWGFTATGCGCGSERRSPDLHGAPPTCPVSSALENPITTDLSRLGASAHAQKKRFFGGIFENDFICHTFLNSQKWEFYDSLGKKY